RTARDGRCGSPLSPVAEPASPQWQRRATRPDSLACRFISAAGKNFLPRRRECRAVGLSLSHAASDRRRRTNIMTRNFDRRELMALAGISGLGIVFGSALAAPAQAQGYGAPAAAPSPE